MLNQVFALTDPRQCERLLEGLQLDGSRNGAATPGVKPLPAQIDVEQPLTPDTFWNSVDWQCGQLTSRRTELTYSIPRRNVAALCLRLGRLQQMMP